MYNKRQKNFDDNCYWQNFWSVSLIRSLKNILSANREDLPVAACTIHHEEATKKSSCRIPEALGEDNIASMVGLSGIHQND